MGMSEVHTPTDQVSEGEAHQPELRGQNHTPALFDAKELTSARRRLANTKSPAFSTTVLTYTSELDRFSEAIKDLANSASEPNVFYEPWMLLPSLKAFGNGSSFLFILVFLNQSGNVPLLCGFFPLEVQSHFRGVPIRVAHFWSYLHFRWCAPLIRMGYEDQCAAEFLQWARSESNPTSLLEFCWLPAHGRFSEALIDILQREDLPQYIAEIQTRALLLKAESPDKYVRTALPGNKVKELRRLSRRLNEKGSVRCEQLTERGDLADWIQDFLRLEASGWKGNAGTALLCSRAQREFFDEVVCSAFNCGQLMMLRLCLGGRAIAYKCNFLSGRGAFAFKIAYDEKYAAFSPGVQLELENIRRFHDMAETDWMDSCADTNHFMANRLWIDRRIVQTIVIAPHGHLGGMWLSLIPFLKWTKRTLQCAIRPQTRDAQ